MTTGFPQNDSLKDFDNLPEPVSLAFVIGVDLQAVLANFREIPDHRDEEELS